MLLRPSLYAMAQLGEPGEIVETYARVMQGSLMDSLAVLHACTDEDVSDLFGTYQSNEAQIDFIPGAAPIEHAIHLAQSLLKHGIVGALKPLPRRADEDPGYMQEFDAREHVALAMAHLGLSERDAWNLTMTGLIGALRAKFPPQEDKSPGARAPSKQEHDATMEWFERVEVARKAEQGAH